ncbi:hypothetical protein L1987_01685 [Smallanthus sonchifolius]|uniref:Uncharacterized protein n=1 Tax=Smallanthus sonchifolius TaxID=185202 RepID=A0ACB9K5W8_9ASTR|nr:hypothetical protein L1987_01685 [Smallanthus sonchifolius]
MLKVSPWKGVARFGNRGKLNPRYVGPFEILARKCLSDESLNIPPNEIHIDEKLHFVEEPIEVTDWKVQRTRRSRVKLVKMDLPITYTPMVLPFVYVEMFLSMFSRKTVSYYGHLEMARRGGTKGGGGGRRGGRTGRRGGASTNQEVEGSVHTTHTKTEVSQHNAEHMEGDDQQFEFEPAIQAALDREFTRIRKETLPVILEEALRKAKENPNSTPVTEEPVVLPAMGGPILIENVALPARGCDYKAFRGCDPHELTGEKEAADTLDWINGIESTIRLSDCRPDQAVRFSSKH